MGYRYKGQVEFIIVLSIIFVAAVVIVLAFQRNIFTPPLPPAIAEQHKAVQAHVESVIREGAIKTITELETHGGYIPNDQTIPVEFTYFIGEPIPYWQKCDSDISPRKADINSRLKNKIKEYVVNSLKDTNEIEGKEVKFDTGKVTVVANILDSKVDFTVNMPTVSFGYSVQQPYTASVNTRFGRLIDFAKDFASEMAEKRHFDVFTKRRLYFDLPSVGFMTRCGEVLYLSNTEISSRLEQIASYVTVNTGLWQDNFILEDGYDVYGIRNVKSRVYNDLDNPEKISFKLPENFETPVYTPIMIVNTELLAKSPIAPLPPICFGYYDHKYSFSYPIIVKAYDPLLRNHFYFSTFVNIQDSEVSSCETISPDFSCSDLSCRARITVLDGKGEPLKDTNVNIGFCTSNKTDSNGLIEGRVSCGDNKLSAFRSADYEIYSEDITVNPGVVYSKTITLHRKPKILFRFGYTDSSCSLVKSIDNELVLLNLTSQDNSKSFLVVNNLEQSDVSSCIETGGFADECDTCDKSIQDFVNDVVESVDTTACDICNVEKNRCLKNDVAREKTIDYIPSGIYKASALILNPARVDAEADRYPFVAAPIATQETLVTIPEEDVKLNVIITDSDIIYNTAKAKYEKTYEDQTDFNCLLEDCRCSSSCAKAAAIKSGMDYVANNIWPLEIRSCG